MDTFKSIIILLGFVAIVSVIGTTNGNARKIECNNGICQEVVINK